MKLTQKAFQLGQKYRIAAALAFVTSAGSAMADGGVDATVIAAGIVAAGVTIAVVGNARLLMDLGVKAFRWVRSAMN